MKKILFIVLALSASAHAMIVGGVDVPAHDPIQGSTAAMYEPSSDGTGGALCTASLIGPNTALTAAHCVQKGSYAPDMIFGNNVRAPDSVHLPVTGIAVNPAWEKNRGRGMDQGDIAVVKFSGKVPPGYHPATMDSTNSDIKKGDSAILAGYGINDVKTHEGAGILRKTSVSVASVRKGKSEMIFDQSRGHGACHGDSGGPAFFQRGQKMVLGGVTNRSYPNSASDDCAHKVVYTKVAAYRPWIEKSEEELNQRPSSSPQLAKLGGPSHGHTLTKKMALAVTKKYRIKNRRHHTLNARTAPKKKMHISKVTHKTGIRKRS